MPFDTRPIVVPLVGWFTQKLPSSRDGGAVTAAVTTLPNTGMSSASLPAATETCWVRSASDCGSTDSANVAGAAGVIWAADSAPTDMPVGIGAASAGCDVTSSVVVPSVDSVTIVVWTPEPVRISSSAIGPGVASIVPVTPAHLITRTRRSAVVTFVGRWSAITDAIGPATVGVHVTVTCAEPLGGTVIVALSSVRVSGGVRRANATATGIGRMLPSLRTASVNDALPPIGTLPRSMPVAGITLSSASVAPSPTPSSAIVVVG